ncbi:MAG: methyltransferase domain-containing protein [candidate division NC10 bacterium]|nr:methyltransferase domain-containing protein [candidate division NC10 bacterium]
MWQLPQVVRRLGKVGSGQAAADEALTALTRKGRQRHGMPFDRLVQLLACPACWGSLEINPAGAALACLGCGAAYSTAGGVPVMLTESSRALLAAGCDPDPTAGRPQRWWSVWFRRFLQAASPGGTSYDPDQDRRIRAMIQNLGGEAAILDLGSGSRWWGPTVIPMDIDKYPHVGLMGDGHRLPFGDGVLDGVICTGVLEHVNDAEAVTREIWRVLRTGGLIYIAVPFIQGYHPASGTHQDFRRLTHVGLQELLSAFQRLDSGVSGGPSSSVAWILREYLALLFFDRGRGYSLAYMVAGWFTWWIRYLDRFLTRREKAHRIACGFYFMGRKPHS